MVIKGKERLPQNDEDQGRNVEEEGEGPVSHVLNQRWSIPVLQIINRGEARFNAIVRQTGINPNTLVDRLREMESLGLISRVIVQEFPLRVEYHLNESITELKEILLRLDNWLVKNGGMSGS